MIKQRNKKMQLNKLVLALLLFLPMHSYADRDHQLFLQGGTYDFSVTANGKSSSVSGLGAWSFGYAYAFADHWKAIVNFNYLYSSTTTGDTATGIDIGAVYYPVTYSGYKYTKNGPLDIKHTQNIRPYIGVAGRQREFVLIITSNYIGYGIFTGVDYQLNENIFLNFEFRMDTLHGGSQDSKASQTNILFGVGVNL